MKRKGTAPGRVLPGLLAALVAAASLACAPKPAAIRVSPSKLTIYGLKRTASIRAEVVDKNDKPVPEAAAGWASSKPDVATVDANGIVKSVSPGRTVLTAKLGELSSAVTAEVVDVGSITVSPMRTTLTGGKGAKTSFTAVVKDSAGSTIDLRPVWTVTTAPIATIDANGTVTAVSEGRTGVVATLGEISGPADLIVLFRDITSFEVTPPTLLLKVGDLQKLNVSARDGSGTLIENVAVTWTSSDPKTALASAGSVKAVAPGSTTIRAVCGQHTVEISALVIP